MRFELFIALRYLFIWRKQSFTSVISLISILGVALGVGALIVVLAVMNGFMTDLREKILGLNAHMLVMTFNGSMGDTEKPLQIVESVPGVVAATPFLYSEVMISTPTGVKGVILRGIDPATAGDVLSVGRDMVEGRLDALGVEDGPPGLIMGADLAETLNVKTGGMVNVLAPKGRDDGAGYEPKVSIFQVKGIFKSGMYEYDSSLVFMSLQGAGELLGADGLGASGLEVKIEDIEEADLVSQRVEIALGSPFYVRSWKEMNANLFAALKLEKIGLFVVLAMIVLVGSFSIVTTLVMLVMEKTRDIAMLMSMGARKGAIRRIFMLQGLLIGVLGTALGFALGLSASLALKRYQFIKLPPDVYSLDHMPVRLEMMDQVIVASVAIGLCFLATLYPAGQAAKLTPAEALRYE